MKKICITQLDDGQYLVADETQEDAQEMQGQPAPAGMPGQDPGQAQAQAPAPAPEQEPEGQSAASLEEALKLAVQLFKGQPGDTPAPPSPFQRGFDSVAQPQPRQGM